MFTFNCKGRIIEIGEPVVMGIINVTPDSFYTVSRKNTQDEIFRQCEKMLEQGAFFLDFGGQSTRPGSQKITPDEELSRVIGIIEAAHFRFPEALLSIDTYYAKVAEQAVEAGAHLVNDISAGNMDENMITAVAELKVPYIAMHMQGTPQNMQTSPDYHNVTLEVLDFFIVKTAECKSAGINDIIVDPGFGFGKTIPHNFELLRNMAELKILDMPILAGLSRKGTIYKTLGITADEALNGTTVLNTLALMNGANILRVHDVKEAIETIKLYHSYRGENVLELLG